MTIVPGPRRPLQPPAASRPVNLGIARSRMRWRAGIACLAALAVVGCGRFSGRGDALTIEPQGGYAIVAQDTRPLVQTITAVDVEPVKGGALLRASALPPTQGYHDAALVREGRGPVDGVLSYRFVARPPLAPAPVSTDRSRELTAAASLSSFDLEGVRRIVVSGATNQRSVSR